MGFWKWSWLAQGLDVEAMGEDGEEGKGVEVGTRGVIPLRGYSLR